MAPVYFEAAAVIVTLVLLGQVLELRARSQTGSAIRGLLDLAPKIAHRVRNGAWIGTTGVDVLDHYGLRRSGVGVIRRIDLHATPASTWARPGSSR